MKALKKQKGFTLVELIIVITILSILGVIAFMSYKGITERTRDANRISTLKELEKGLSIFKEKTGNYPTPEGKIYTGVLSLSGYVDYSYVGIVGENISNQLKLNGIPLDPLSNTNYIYATNINKTSYQIATVLEVLQAYKKPEQNMKFDKGELCLIQKTYANSSSYKAKVLGTHKENVKIENGGKTWLTTVPSMIFDPTVLSGNILNSSGSYLIVNKGKNLPYKLNSNDTTANQNGNEIMQILKENTNAKIATIDITEIVNKTKTVEQIFGTGGTEEKIPGITSKEILSSFGVKEEDLGNTSAITSKMETIISGQTSASQSQIPSTPTYSNCTLSGETINHGSSITTYNETSILWNAVYSCDDRKITRTCNNGTLSGDSSYEYTSCIKGTVNNCSASGSYVNNGHTYNIPTITHNTSTGNILSSTVNENNGQFKYTLTSIECNDGVFINVNENPTGTVQSCNSGYGINGNSCSASQNGVCDNTVALGCSTGTTISDNGQTTCGTTRTWNCAGLYGGSTSAECSKANAVCTVSGACTGIIANAVYYGDVTSYSLTNAPNGTSLTASYSATPTINTCQYKCNTNYTWNGSSCVANTQTGNCTALSSDKVYYNSSQNYSFTQAWNGSAWAPATTQSYLATPTINTCQYKCNTNYTWNGSSCVANTQTGNCTALSSDKVYYNSSQNYSFTQAWNGSAWAPATTQSYLATPTINTCQYKCNTNYTWNGSNACTDQTPPTITSITTSSPACNTVRFSINGASDLIAMNATPYSFDVGTTWQAANTKDYSSLNQTIASNQIKVRDAVGNVYTYVSSSNGTSTSCSPSVPILAVPSNITSSSITWNWTAGVGGGTVSYYNLMNGLSVVYSGILLTYTESNLTANTGYTHTVKACNEGGCSAVSSNITGITTMTMYTNIDGSQTVYLSDSAKGSTNFAITGATNNIVYDKITGLYWERIGGGGLGTNWQSLDYAKSYCATLTLGDYTDWRLPDTNELMSIVDYGRANPSIDTYYFTNMQSGQYQTSSTSSYTGPSSDLYIISFSKGYKDEYVYFGYFICVR